MVVDQLEDIHEFLNKVNIPYSSETGGFYAPNHNFKIQKEGYLCTELSITNDEGQPILVDTNIFLRTIKETEKMFCELTKEN